MAASGPQRHLLFRFFLPKAANFLFSINECSGRAGTVILTHWCPSAEFLQTEGGKSGSAINQPILSHQQTPEGEGCRGMTEHRAIGPGLALSVHHHLMARDDAPDAPHL